MTEELKQSIISIKDLNGRQFKIFTENFHLIKASIRYFKVKKQLSFTASKISDNFPLTIPAAGSSLSILKELEVVKPRKRSSSPDLYMPGDVDLERLEKIEEILVENLEIEEFYQNTEN